MVVVVVVVERGGEMRDNRLARGAGRDIVGASWWSLSSMMGWCGSLSS